MRACVRASHQARDCTPQQPCATAAALHHGTLTGCMDQMCRPGWTAAGELLQREARAFSRPPMERRQPGVALAFGVASALTPVPVAVSFPGCARRQAVAPREHHQSAPPGGFAFNSRAVESSCRRGSNEGRAGLAAIGPDPPPPGAAREPTPAKALPLHAAKRRRSRPLRRRPLPCPRAEGGRAHEREARIAIAPSALSCTHLHHGDRDHPDCA